MEVITDEKKIDELLTRSIAAIYPNKSDLKNLLLSGKKLRVYVGIDPTATYVHLGHATNYLLLKRFYDLGHNITVLIGDFTAMIGDPSDKSALRKRLTKEDVLQNLDTFKSQIGKILNFESKENPVEFRFNSEWLASLTFADAVELASHFTVQQMLQRDNFEKRLTEEKPLYVHEFFYPLMQGYDSVALDADVEIGGTDQTFNMLAGRTLQKQYKNKDKFVITTTLLENPITKEKLMSKSLGTGIGLDISPFEMYSKVMQLPDEAIIQVFIDCTELSMKEIENMQHELENKKNFRDIKEILAFEIVKLFHGNSWAEMAKGDFKKAFVEDAIPENVETFTAEPGTLLIDLFTDKGIVESKSDFKRLVDEGAITNLEKNEKVSDWHAETSPGTYKIGKRRFVKVV